MKAISFAAIAAMVWACGGESFESPDGELGELEQAVSSDVRMGFRIDVTGSDTSCGTGLSTEMCLLPPSKTVTFRATGEGMSASQKTDAETQIDDSISVWGNDVPSTWTMSRLTSGNANVNIRYATLPGTNKNSIHTYSRITTVHGTTALSDSVIGEHAIFNRLTCTVDNAKINADFLTAQRPKVRKHAIQHCMTKGLGLGAGGGTGRAYAIAVTPDAFKNTDFAGTRRCWMSQYIETGNTYTPNLIANCPGSDD